MQLPGGWMADRYGSKKVVLVTLFLWSVFTVLTGFVWSLLSLIVIRFLFGIGEGSFPCASFKGIPEYFPRSERPKMISMLVSSNYVGSALAPLLVAPLLLAFGWRHMFWIIGIAGVSFVLVYAMVVRKPVLQDEGAAKARQKVDIKALMRMPLMWQLVLAWFGLSLVNKGLDSWMPTYLMTVRHLNLKNVGIFITIPFVAAGIATALGGWIMDRFFDKREKYLLILSASLSAIFLYFMYTAKTVGDGHLLPEPAVLLQDPGAGLGAGAAAEAAAGRHRRHGHRPDQHRRAGGGLRLAPGHRPDGGRLPRLLRRGLLVPHRRGLPLGGGQPHDQQRRTLPARRRRLMKITRVVMRKMKMQMKVPFETSSG